jgi:hypothetical protein
MLAGFKRGNKNGAGAPQAGIEWAMTKSLPMTTLQQLDARLHEQVLEVAALRLALDIQRLRVAHMPPARDMRLHASKRRAPRLAALLRSPSIT